MKLRATAKGLNWLSSKPNTLAVMLMPCQIAALTPAKGIPKRGLKQGSALTVPATMKTKDATKGQKLEPQLNNVHRLTRVSAAPAANSGRGITAPRKSKAFVNFMMLKKRA